MAACSVCLEGAATCEIFASQIESFYKLSMNAELRCEAAINIYNKMVGSFSFEKYGPEVPFGTEDGCIQGAYISGHPYGVAYLSLLERYFVGTYLPSLGIPEDFQWSSQKDDQGQPKSGPVFRSKQFVMCANEQELFQVIGIVKKHLSAD